MEIDNNLNNNITEESDISDFLNQIWERINQRDDNTPTDEIDDKLMPDVIDEKLQTDVIDEKLQIDGIEDKLIIDRFENDIVICENRKTREMVKINRNQLPEDIKEGTVIKFDNGKYIKDIEEQQEIEQRINKKMNDIWNN